MGVTQQYVCDLCGTTLSGYEKAAQVKRRYIVIRGNVSVEFWDKKTDRRGYFFVSYDRNGQLCFCDSECFNNFIDMREKESKQVDPLEGPREPVMYGADD
jgi:hypothetical protein